MACCIDCHGISRKLCIADVAIYNGIIRAVCGTSRCNFVFADCFGCRVPSCGDRMECRVIAARTRYISTPTDLRASRGLRFMPNLIMPQCGDCFNPAREFCIADIAIHNGIIRAAFCTSRGHLIFPYGLRSGMSGCLDLGVGRIIASTASLIGVPADLRASRGLCIVLLEIMAERLCENRAAYAASLCGRTCRCRSGNVPGCRRNYLSANKACLIFGAGCVRSEGMPGCIDCYGPSREFYAADITIYNFFIRPVCGTSRCNFVFTDRICCGVSRCRGKHVSADGARLCGRTRRSRAGRMTKRRDKLFAAYDARLCGRTRCGRAGNMSDCLNPLDLILRCFDNAINVRCGCRAANIGIGTLNDRRDLFIPVRFLTFRQIRCFNFASHVFCKIGEIINALLFFCVQNGRCHFVAYGIDALAEAICRGCCFDFRCHFFDCLIQLSDKVLLNVIR